MLKKIGMLVLFSTLIAGCSTPGPQLLRGFYYWTGDSSCESSSYRTDTSINCYNSDEEATGYRNAMTNQEMQAYRYEQQKKRQELRQAIKQYPMTVIHHGGGVLNNNKGAQWQSIPFPFFKE